MRRCSSFATKLLQLAFFLFFALAILTPLTLAAPPVVKTVPWVAANPLVPHDTWSGKAIRLKGTSDVAGAYTWDFGDGSEPATGTVDNNTKFAIEAVHVYDKDQSGVPFPEGTVFTARLTVTNGSESSSKEYFIELRAKTLQVEINVAVDEGLWYLHKTMSRSTSAGIDYGNWSGTYAGLNATNLHAFEVNGHLESGDPSNPYTETVARALKTLFTQLSSVTFGQYSYDLSGTPVSPHEVGGTPAQFVIDADGNGNNLGISVMYSGYGHPFYQGGMVIDAIAASGTPDKVTTTGGSNVLGRTYKDIVQDMVDLYAACQTPYASTGGGWYYSCGSSAGDNSISQWAAIGLLGAVRAFGVTVDPQLFQWNSVWVTNSQCNDSYWDYWSNTNVYGTFGYGSACYFAWGPYATTPSGLVQLVMDGIGRGDPRWDNAETFIRDRFGNTGDATTAIRSYYYGLFSFTKAMLLHSPGHNPSPITFLQSTTPSVDPIDWYAAEAANGDPTDGVARKLVNDQLATGQWTGHEYSYEQSPFETGWALIMLNRTLFEGGAPVAVPKALPNPAVAGQIVSLDGSSSFHQDQSKRIVAWAWDLDNDNTFELTGIRVSGSWECATLPTTPCNYPVKLRVTDNTGSTAVATVTVRITMPPIAPTANAGGPYVFCGAGPWFLNGSGSVNPDEGSSEPGAPGDTIYGADQFTWTLLGVNAPPRTGVTPDVSGLWVPGSYLVQLQVCDTSKKSFPSLNLAADLCGMARAEVQVLAACPTCTEINKVLEGDVAVQIEWSSNTDAHHYNIYRATVEGQSTGPYLFIGSSTTTTFLDTTVTAGTNYSYVVRPVNDTNKEICESAPVTASATGRKPVLLVPDVGACLSKRMLNAQSKQATADDWALEDELKTYKDLYTALVAAGYTSSGGLENPWRPLSGNHWKTEDVADRFFPAPFDWRMPLDRAVTSFLIPQIDRAKTTSGRTKVDIIAHGMGALMVRSYIEGAGYRNDVDKFITIGAPNHGFAPAHYLWQGGELAQGGDLLLANAWQYLKAAYVSYKGGLYNSFARYVQGTAPGLQALMPTDDFLVDQDKGPKAYNSLSALGQNPVLKALNNDVGKLTARATVKSLVGSELATVEQVTVKNATPVDAFMNRWVDGKPVGTVRNESGGDGTVLTSSAALQGITSEPAKSKASHQTLPSKAAGDVVSLLVKPSPPLSGVRRLVAPLTPEVQRNLSIFMVSLLDADNPAQMLVTDPNGAKVGWDSASQSDISGGMAGAIADSTYSGHDVIETANIPNPATGSYEVTIIGNATGEYYIVAYYMTPTGQATMEGVGTVEAGKTSSFTFVIPGADPEVNQLQSEGLLASTDLAVGYAKVPAAPVAIGVEATYWIDVANDSAVDAAGVQAVITPDSKAPVVSVSTTQGSCTTAGAITCNLGVMAAGNTARITLVVKPSTQGTVTNSVGVTSSVPDFAPANNAAISAIVVEDLADFALAMAAPPATAPLKAGNWWTYDIALAQKGAWNSPITFSCGNGLPPGAACWFTPNPVTPSGATTVVRMVLSTTAHTVSVRGPMRRTGSPLFAWWMALAAIGPFGGVFVHQKSRKARLACLLLALLLVALFLVLLTGCGGGTRLPDPQSGTPAGSYSITVNATSGAVTRSMVVNVVVE